MGPCGCSPGSVPTGHLPPSALPPPLSTVPVWGHLRSPSEHSDLVSSTESQWDVDCARGCHSPLPVPGHCERCPHLPCPCLHPSVGWAWREASASWVMGWPHAPRKSGAAMVPSLARSFSLQSFSSARQQPWTCFRSRLSTGSQFCSGRSPAGVCGAERSTQCGFQAAQRQRCRQDTGRGHRATAVSAHR